MSKKCSECNTQLNDTTKFCPACGAAAQTAIPIAEVPTASSLSPREVMLQLKAYFDPMAEKYDKAIELSTQLNNLEKPEAGGSIVARSLGLGIVAFFGGMIALIVFDLFILLIVGWIYAAYQTIQLIGGIRQASSGNPAIQQYENTLQQLRSELSEVEAELQAHYDRYVDCPISFEYSAPPILNELNTRIISGRADSIKEAIQCMLDDMHKAEMLELQKQTAENAKKAADSAKSAANSASMTSVMVAANHLNRKR